MTDGAPLLALLSASLLGGLLGCLTGMLPGLHSNNVASGVGERPGLLLTVATLGLLSSDASGGGLVAACAVMACAVAHTVANIVPSVFFAVPEGDTALSVLPGHRMARAGMGGEALGVSVTSSLASLALALALVVPVRMLMGPPLHLYAWLSEWIGPGLLGVSLLMALKETRKSRGSGRLHGGGACLAALLVLVGAGGLGHIALMDAGLVAPLFIGLFGIPMVLLALAGPRLQVPPADEATPGRPRRTPWGAVIRGSLAGTLAGWFPGISSAQATVLGVVGDQRDDGDIGGARRFIAGVSAVNTANAVFTLVALATLLRVRSGAMAAVGSIMAWEEAPWASGALPGPRVVPLLAAAALGGLLAAPVTMAVGSRVQALLPLLSRKWALAGMLVALVWLATIEGSWSSGAVVVAASALGLVPPLLGLMRVHLMGALTVPLALGGLVAT